MKEFGCFNVKVLANSGLSLNNFLQVTLPAVYMSYLMNNIIGRAVADLLPGNIPIFWMPQIVVTSFLGMTLFLGKLRGMN